MVDKGEEIDCESVFVGKSRLPVRTTTSCSLACISSPVPDRHKSVLHQSLPDIDVIITTSSMTLGSI